jgi:hypothetical protein
VAGITVYTTPGNAYTLANGTGIAESLTPTGELAVQVYGVPSAGSDTGPWLGSFGSVEAVYLNGEAVRTAASRSSGI